MGERDRQESLEYEVRFDPEANRRYSIAAIKANSWQWVRSGLVSAAWIAAFTCLMLFTGTFHSTAEAALLAVFSAAVGLIITFVWYWEHVRRSIIQANHALFEEVWQCELTPEAWSFTNRVGVKTSIPWGIMELEFEQADAWLIRFGGEDVVVYRQPLRDAGLEGEFLRRVAKAKAPD